MRFFDFIKTQSKDRELPPYIEKILDRIEEKILLNNIPRMLIITIPPRSLKTTIAFKYFSQWIIKQFSDKQIGEKWFETLYQGNPQ